MSEGIGALIPQYPKDLLSPADLTYWEALYDDGSVLRETDGKPYAAIDRGRLMSFRIIGGGETLIETFVPAGATGYNLVYRRRTAVGSGGRQVLFLFGWAPMGPVFLLDPATASYRIAEGFDPNDPALAPPVPMPGEPAGMLPLDDATMGG